MEHSHLIIYNNIYKINDFLTLKNEEDLKEIAEIHGHLNKKLTILVNNDKIDQKNDKIDFIYKIFSSVGISKDDIAIVFPKASFPFRSLKKIIKLKDVFFFGYQGGSFDLSINKTDYKAILIGEQRLVFCESLSELQNNTESKKRLWELLKSMYQS